MRKYELMMIVNPELGDDDRNTLITEIKSELVTPETKIVSEDLQGVKDLAYKINNSTKGFYILFTLESEGGSFFDVTKSFNIKKDIWRHMFVRIDE